MTRPIAGSITIAAYIATIPAANLAITHLGVVPVGFGYLAPAGAYFVGISLVLRDLAREWAGRWPVVAAVLAGALLSYLVAGPALALASGLAFLLSEGLDFAAYEPLRERGLVAAMGASNLVGMVADSLVFLWIAFHSLAYLPGQLLGKFWMTAVALAVIALIRRTRQAVPA